MHLGYGPISDLYVDSERAARNAHSVLRAFEATALYLIVWALVPWKPLKVRYAASLLCACGALLSFQIGACRLAFPLDKPSPPVADGQGLCDLATGLPVYKMTLGAIMFAILLAWMRRKRKD